MNAPPDVNSQEHSQPLVGLEWEYQTLRAEILSRMEQRQQIASLALTIAGIFLGVGLNTPGIALVYPPLAMCLAFAWMYNDRRVREIAKYIRDHIEVHVPGLNWERTMKARYDAQRNKTQQDKQTQNTWGMLVIAHVGTFLWTQVMALGVGLIQMVDYWMDEGWRHPMTLTQTFLFIAGIISMVVVLRLMQQAYAHSDDESKIGPAPAPTTAPQDASGS